MAIREGRLVKWAAALKQLERPGEPLIPGGACALRRQFRQLVRDTSLTHMDLQVYSLRRGGATNMFRECASFDSVADRGRWRNVRTCRIYIDAALQDAASLKEASKPQLKAGLEALSLFLQGL